MVDMDQTVILACSSFRDYLSAAQKKMHTDLPVIWLDERLHRDPALMREAILSELERLPETVKTVLVCMGFCGGSWADVPARQRIVIPRADDCVSILLHTARRRGFDLKDPGHLYVKGPDPRAASFKEIFRRMTETADEEAKRAHHKRWRDSYCGIDVIRAGIYDCDAEDYLAPVREDARFLEAEMRTVEGSNLILEKPVSGRWDDCFCVFEPGTTVTRSAVERAPSAEA